MRALPVMFHARAQRVSGRPRPIAGPLSVITAVTAIPWSAKTQAPVPCPVGVEHGDTCRHTAAHGSPYARRMTDSPRSSRRTLATASVVLGALACVVVLLGAVWAGLTGGMALLSIVPLTGFVAVPLAVAGALTGVTALLRTQARGLALTGLGLSALPLVAAVIMLVMWAPLLTS